MLRLRLRRSARRRRAAVRVTVRARVAVAQRLRVEGLPNGTLLLEQHRAAVLDLSHAFDLRL